MNKWQNRIDEAFASEKPLAELMQEAYEQGKRDAIKWDVISEPDRPGYYLATYNFENMGHTMMVHEIYWGGDEVGWCYDEETCEAGETGFDKVPIVLAWANMPKPFGRGNA